MTTGGSRRSRARSALDFSFWLVVITATILLWAHDQSASGSLRTPSGNQSTSSVLGANVFVPPPLGPGALICASAGSDGSCTPTASGGSDPASAATSTPWIAGYNNCGDITLDGAVDQADMDLEGEALEFSSPLARFDVNRDGLVNYWDKLVIRVQLGAKCRR